MNHALMICNMLLEDVAKDPSRLKRAQEIAEKELGSVPSEKATTLSDRLKDFAKPPYSEYDRIRDQEPQVSSPSAEAFSDIERRVVEMIRYIGVKAGIAEATYGEMCHEARCILRNAHLDYAPSSAAEKRPIYPGLWSDAALGQTLEGIIALRTHFTGEPPYVGNDGVVLALNEALDELESLRSATAVRVPTRLRAGDAPNQYLRGYTDGWNDCIDAALGNYEANGENDVPSTDSGRNK